MNARSSGTPWNSTVKSFFSKNSSLVVAAPLCGWPARPNAVPESGGRRWSPTAHRWGRSCSNARCRAPAPSRPGLPAHRGPAHRLPPTAGTTGSRALLRTRRPRCVGRAASPTPTTALSVGTSHPDLGQLLLIAADGHCGMGRLVRVNPDDHRHQFLLRGRIGTARALLV